MENFIPITYQRLLLLKLREFSTYDNGEESELDPPLESVYTFSILNEYNIEKLVVLTFYQFEQGSYVELNFASNYRNKWIYSDMYNLINCLEKIFDTKIKQNIKRILFMDAFLNHI